MPIFTTELSDSLEQLIIAKLEPYLMQTFGYHALFYTPLAKTLCQQSLSIKHQFVIAPENTTAENQSASLLCCYEELPIASDSIDLAILPNILQNSTQPHQVLREVERVLIPEGTLILIGRKPFSWQGIKKRITTRDVTKELKTFDISPRRVIDWFRLLGLETEVQINLSMTHKKLQQSQLSPWLKKAGEFFCDYFASYYIIIAKKKVSTLTPIRPSWRKNKQLVPPRLAEPSVKGQVESWFEHLK